MHARMPKNFVLEERLERYAAAIEPQGWTFRGRWAEACHALGEDGPYRFERVHLDLGCGKGSFLVQMAQRHPETLFIGMDYEPVCIAYAAQAIVEAGLPNALAVPGDGGNLKRLFGTGELDAVTINFPTPHPKRRDAHKRLTTAAHLAALRPLLDEDGTVTFRTDSQPLFDYSLPQFRAAGFEALWESRDVRADHPEIPETEYEQRLSAQGAKICGICAQADLNAPEGEILEKELARALELPQSLFDYLPDNLFEDAYIPHGMSYAIDNFRNRRIHEEARTLDH